MADFSEMLSQLLSSDEGKQQISQVLSMLGQGGSPSGGQTNNSNNNSNSNNNNSSSNNNNMPDLSALLSSLGGANNNNNNNSGNSMPDLSALLSSLGGGSNNNNNNNSGNNMPNLGALLSSLGGGGGNENSGLPNLDIGKLMNIQKLLSQRKDDSSTALLRALKPHLAEENRKKVDEAVRIMELLDLLPLIKESGLLGSLLGGDNG